MPNMPKIAQSGHPVCQEHQLTEFLAGRGWGMMEVNQVPLFSKLFYCCNLLILVNKLECLPLAFLHLSGAPIQGRLLALNTNIRLGRAGLPGTNGLQKCVSCDRKKFHNIGRSCSLQCYVSPLSRAIDFLFYSWSILYHVNH